MEVNPSEPEEFLPTELWVHVCTFLPASSLIALMAVNRWAHALATSPSLWRLRVLERAGHKGQTHEDIFREADDATSWRQTWACLERRCHQTRCAGCAKAPIDGPLFKCLTCSERLLDTAPPQPLVVDPLDKDTNVGNDPVGGHDHDKDNKKNNDANDHYFCRDCEGNHPRLHLLMKMRCREQDLAPPRMALYMAGRPIIFNTMDDQSCCVCGQELHGPCYAERHGDNFRCLACYEAVDDAQRDKHVYCSVPVHEQGYYCNGCRSGTIRGIRWKCMQCYDFDFCEECEAAKTEPFMKAPARTTPGTEVLPQEEEDREEEDDDEDENYRYGTTKPHSARHAFLKVSSHKYNQAFLRHRDSSQRP